MMSRPTVFCSHNFVNVNLNNDKGKLSVPIRDSNRRTDENRDNMTDEAVKEEQESVLIMTIIDAYSCRMKKEKWLDTEHPYYDSIVTTLPEMTLRTFASQHYVGSRGGHCNKIKHHS